MGELVPFFAVTALAAACGAPLTAAEKPGNEAPAAVGSKGVDVTKKQVPLNQRFGSLDEYLAYLKRAQAPIDGPWYREIRPGVYELQTGGNLHLEGGNPPKQVFTREELERKFGFSQ